MTVPLSLLRLFLELITVLVLLDQVRSKIVDTSFGKVRGRSVQLPYAGLPQVEQYLGIPYGAPPVGSRRFMMPQTATKWTNTIKDATRMPPACIQFWPPALQLMRAEAMKWMTESRHTYLKKLSEFLRDQQEDCLNLNLYVPSKRGECTHDELCCHIHTFVANKPN
ncbi:unnamed protein product [Soboliphyme baturini]|uniref:COesterase domain-containing protein n=1 Tax=Soboliphyme baturini TaxID=241478 RepID=A0A183ILT8_9BILA|nr:unnamed protein product [Soboliphyme baturini]